MEHEVNPYGILPGQQDGRIERAELHQTGERARSSRELLVLREASGIECHGIAAETYPLALPHDGHGGEQVIADQPGGQRSPERPLDRVDGARCRHHAAYRLSRTDHRLEPRVRSHEGAASSWYVSPRHRTEPRVVQIADQAPNRVALE